MTIGQVFLVLWARKWAVIGMVILGIAAAISVIARHDVHVVPAGREARRRITDPALDGTAFRRRHGQQLWSNMTDLHAVLRRCSGP